MRPRTARTAGDQASRHCHAKLAGDSASLILWREDRVARIEQEEAKQAAAQELMDGVAHRTLAKQAVAMRDLDPAKILAISVGDGMEEARRRLR